MNRWTRSTSENLENMGQPLPRYEAGAKVLGQPLYSTDTPIKGLLHASLVTSAIAKGTLGEIDIRSALSVKGVIGVYTAETIPHRLALKHGSAGGRAADSNMPLEGKEVRHAGQIVAVVIAESPEIAREAAGLVTVSYAEVQQPSASFGSDGLTTSHPPQLARSEKSAGAFDDAFGRCEVKLDEHYSTPANHHNTMEPYSTTAVWSGDRLTPHESSRWVHNLKQGVAEMLGIDPENVHIQSPHMGGSFGSRSFVLQHTGLIAIIARDLRRPVRLVMTRSQGFIGTTYRAETRHRIRLGASASGRLIAYAHEGQELSSRYDNYSVAGTGHTAEMYGWTDVTTRIDLFHADRSTPGFMRSPPEQPYMYALETAMDELAVKLQMDPIELRRANDTQTSPISGGRFTSRALMTCFDKAAERFGWHTRDPRPRYMTEGEWLIGFGCAASSYPVILQACAARVSLRSDGRAHVEIAVHDVGAGAYTAVRQIAARALNLDPTLVTVELGDSRLPPGPPAGGSMTTASAGSAVLACVARIAQRFGGSIPASADLRAAFDRIGLDRIEDYAEWSPFGPDGTRAINNGRAFFPPPVARAPDTPPNPLRFSFGAGFVEVRVHRLTREIRIERMTGAYEGGYIVNPLLARSQFMAGMIWGAASALHEATEIDTLRARYVNDNLAEYLMPVNADVPEIDVILVPQVDDQVNPVGVKGIGELGNVGMAAAVSNAVYHATGRRIRDLPITIEKLI
jgi:xanthine dehydrogenase YagR molybdenum-binding subunit